jgi:hypothetical protein
LFGFNVFSRTAGSTCCFQAPAAQVPCVAWPRRLRCWPATPPPYVRDLDENAADKLIKTFVDA